MPLSDQPNPYSQLSVMAGDALGINPASNTRYFFGLNVNIDPTTANTAYAYNLSAPAILTGFVVVVTVLGAVDTAANNVAFSVRVNGTTDYGTTNVTFQSVSNVVSSPVLSQPLNKGDLIQITFLTPNPFTTLPQNVFFTGGILVNQV